MKRIIVLILALSVSCLPMEARRRWIPIITAGGSQQRDTVSGAATVSNYFAFNSNLAIACKFTAAGTYTITKAEITAHKVLSPTYDVVLAIYTDTGGTGPGTLVGTASAVVNSNTGFPGSAGIVTFTGISASLTSGTPYWVVLYAVSGGNDFTNYTVWDSINTGATGSWIAATQAGSWASFQTPSTGIMTLYSP